MKKRIISLMLVAVLGCCMHMQASTAYAEEAGEGNNSVGGGTLLYETDVITQKDYEEDFRNYASSDATVNLASNARTFINAELANVVGVVKDYDTEDLIADATISVDGEAVVVTDEDGRFQIDNIPSDVYNWEINALGYCTADYYNYDVDYADGTTIFTFYISRDFAVSQDREEVIHNEEDGQAVPQDTVDRGTFVTSASARSMSTVPSVSSTVNVYYNGAKHIIGRQMYIYTVLSSELYTTSYYTNLGLTTAQTAELYHAQAVAANTFLEYAMSVYSNHSSVGCDVCAGTCCQVYDPTKVTQAAIDATTKIFYTAGSGERTDIVMYKQTSTTYDYIWGAFSSSCYNKGTLTHNSEPALKAVSCTDIATGSGGHRYGLCQMGAATRAKNGNPASSILLYYYSSCGVASCPLK